MGVIKRISSFFEYWYFQYITHTALYMLESWERQVFNSLLIAFVAMASYTTYLFMPGHIAMLVRFYNYMMGVTTDDSTVTMETSTATMDVEST